MCGKDKKGMKSKELFFAFCEHTEVLEAGSMDMN